MAGTQVDYEALLSIPAWANFLAVDGDGELWAYQKMPRYTKYSTGWSEPSKDGEVELICKIINYSGDWKNSLIERQKA